MGRDGEITVLERVESPGHRVLQAHQQHVELDVALSPIVHQERIFDVLLHHVHRARLGKVHALRRLRADLHRGSPIPVGLLDEPGVAGVVLDRLSAVSPLEVFDDVRVRHEIGHELPHFGLILQPDAPLDVHGDAAEVRLVRKVHEALAQRTVVLVVLLVLEPLLVRVDVPLAPLEQVLAEPLSMTAHLAVGTVKELPLAGLEGLWNSLVCGDHQALVVDGLLHDLHLQSALLDLALGDRQVLPHHGLVHAPQPCGHRQVLRDAAQAGRQRLGPHGVRGLLGRDPAGAFDGVLDLQVCELQL
mmetsp:Transcript_100909/g.301029  ORF Transcript_100909/g.301029 Transcript_100909/m.301029 type:complete len:302 (-) Transcript_100909:721-1626(-)